MADLIPVWKTTYGGALPKGAATAFRPIVAELGVEEVAARLRAYCEQTPAQYASVHRFVQTHGGYSAEARKAASGKAALDELEELGKQDPWWTMGLRSAA